MYDESNKEIKTGTDKSSDNSPAKTELHDAHLLILEVVVGCFDNPVEAAVLLSVVYFSEGAVKDYHTEPLEAAEPLVEDESFEVEEPKEIQILAGGVEVVHYRAVLKDEVREI